MNNKLNKTIILIIFSALCWTNSLHSQRIAAGGWHSLAICTDSTVKAFGENATGELGDGTYTDKNTPVSVKKLSGIIAVSAGGDQLEAHSMALKSDGTVWTWGSNLYGGLGDGTNNSTTEPVQTLLISDVVSISAGGWHSSALKKDSSVWVWGWNSDGQIGDGTTVDRTLPTKVNGLTGIKQIAAGTYHMLALKSDGTVWAWGNNDNGQIGDSSTTDRNTPVKVKGLSNVVRISAGRFFSLAIKSDGTVWTWGENQYGQLGNGNLGSSSVPVQVSGLTGIISATAATGAFHCIAIKDDNTVWAWGRNTYGNLGDGTVNNSSIPVKMSGVSNVAGVAAGTNFTLLYKTDGTFWACGRNASGQLGDGSVLQRNSVVQSTGVCSIVNPVDLEDLFKNKTNLVFAYPNPVQSILNIQAESMATIEIMSLNGQILLSQKIDEFNNSIDLEAFNAGYYLVKMSTDSGVYYMKIQKY
ncbi:MAG TPA: T9SS type A sorting domain-containing protein [Bacteroidia bacterium]